MNQWKTTASDALDRSWQGRTNHKYHQFDTAHLHLLNKVERVNEEAIRHPATV